MIIRRDVVIAPYDRGDRKFAAAASSRPTGVLDRSELRRDVVIAPYEGGGTLCRGDLWSPVDSRLSKGDNAAMPTHMPLETGSDYTKEGGY